MNTQSKSRTAAQIAIVTSSVSLALLVALHILSPEFDPAWRMVSEYANGNYAWVLSLFFPFWAISTWALAYAIWPQVKTKAGKIGFYFLVASGFGEFMGGLFDINHPLHGLSAMIGIPSLAIAAMLISLSLVKNEPWVSAKKSLLWTASLTWVSIVLMAIAFAVMIATFTQSGAETPADGAVVTTLPAGVIGLVGWANRFLVLVYNMWVIVVARHLTKINGSKF